MAETTMTISNLLERNLLPDTLIRFGIRRLLRQRLKQEDLGDPEAQQEHLMQLIEGLRKSPIALHTTDANEQHYEVPTEFFKHVLGPHMKYSSGYWREGVDSLGKSEEDMLDLTCSRADLKNGMDILELGCGWGSLTLFMAARFPKSRITAVSNSRTQKLYIDGLAKKRVLKNIRVITADMNSFTIKAKFDRVVSVEMFEHMRNYERLLAKVASVLRSDGKLFVHIFTHKDFAYPFDVKDDSDWMAKFFFTGGIMPSDDLLLYFADDMTIANHWHVSGTHYQKTSEAWLSKMDANRNVIEPILRSTYGEANATKWWVYWRVFFMACAELWGYRDGTEWMVGHYMFQKRQLKKSKARSQNTVVNRVGGRKIRVKR
jgi:cyclopropane-fatty-acyl-phospholipid synthase